MNPRKLWYESVEAIEAPEPHTVVFRLKHPQPSLLLMLASGYSPVYPAHVPLAEFKNRCIGTGPFKLKENKPGELVEYVKNPDYFIKGRPYLDGIKFVDHPRPLDPDRRAAVRPARRGRQRLEQDQRRERQERRAASWSSSRPTPTSTTTCSSTSSGRRSPTSRVRRAINLALDRKAYLVGPRQGAATFGGALLPKPAGVWGLPAAEVAKLPGHGRSRQAEGRGQEAAGRGRLHRRQPAEDRRSPRARWRSTSTPPSWMVDQLQQVGIEATLEQIETGVWHPKMTRLEYQVALNLTGTGIDDPDAQLFENYRCGSQRNFSGYCSEEIDRLMVEQSQTLDPKQAAGAGERDRPQAAGRRRAADPGLGQAVLRCTGRT